MSLEWPEARPPEEALSRVLADQWDTIERQGYLAGNRTARSASFRRRRLFYPRNERFTILATGGENAGSTLMVEGSMRRKLRSRFAELGELRRNGSQTGNNSEAQTSKSEMRTNSNGSKPRDPADLENELRQIYELVGKPSAFGEAKGKVMVLADCLGGERGIDRKEALALGYERSLAEHRQYLAAKGISP